jgi:spore coat polysaccharide biosynthesis predicted glycosyltransferase SpsG
VTVLFWVDAGRDVGLGHVSRGLAVAEALGARGVRVRFVVPADPVALEALRAAGHPSPVVLPPGAPPRPFVLAAAAGAAAVVIDVCRPLDVADVRAVGAAWPVVAIDNAGPGVAEADLAVQLVGEPSHDVRRLVGPAFVPLRRAALVPGPRPVRRRRPVVLVSMGASDAGRLALRTVEALAALRPPAPALRVVARAGSSEWDGLAARLAALEGARLRPVAPGAFTAHLRAVDVAVLALGVSVYEALAAGVPAIVLCRTEGDAAHARALAASGALVSLGIRWTAARLARAVARLAADARRRAARARAGRALVDGRGAVRIAGAIVDLVAGEGVGSAGGRLRA